MRRKVRSKGERREGDEKPAREIESREGDRKNTPELEIFIDAEKKKICLNQSRIQLC